MSRLYRGRKLLEEAMLQYARSRGYLRADERPARWRGDEPAPSATADPASTLSEGPRTGPGGEFRRGAGG